MRTIIAGSRSIDQYKHVLEATAACGWKPSVVLCGGARGADAWGKLWATKRGIPVEDYPADWTAHGKAAGPIRNEQMAARADALIALWDGESQGTKHMIELAKKRGMAVYVHLVVDDVMGVLA